MLEVDMKVTLEGFLIRYSAELVESKRCEMSKWERNSAGKIVRISIPAVLRRAGKSVFAE